MSEYMTPGQASRYLRAYRADRTGYIPSYAVDALAALAADTVEWAVMLTYGKGDYAEDYIDEDWWYPAESEAREALGNAKRGTPHLSPRLVARRVSAPWEVTP